MNQTYRITPIIVATGPHREVSRFTYLNGFGDKVSIPYVAWLIRGGDVNVLTDTGCSADAYAQHIRPASGSLMVGGEQFADVVDVTPLDKGLAEHGLSYADIDVVIQTHLDWDHCMGTSAFTRSKVLIQKDELEDLPVHPLYSRTHAPEYVYHEIRALDLQVVDGDYRIADGLEVIYTPGHTAGGQSVVVNTRLGTHVITGLCTLKANYYLSDEQKAELGYEVIPPGMHLDARVAYASVQRILQIGGDHVLANHDPSNAQLGTIQ
jgi:N-acyl homoserine lactone hydrolase